jgi:hypothetical protein
MEIAKFGSIDLMTGNQARLMLFILTEEENSQGNDIRLTNEVLLE